MEPELLDYVCRQCCQLGSLYAVAYETWNRNKQESEFREGEEWNCLDCGDGVAYAEIVLPSSTWHMLDAYLLSDPDDPLRAKYGTSGIKEIWMDMPEQTDNDDNITLSGLFEQAFRIAGIAEQMPIQAIEKEVQAIKTFLAL
jgi:hypothetical protein